jgi:serine/threonine protein phosphatase PrpC
MTALPLKPNISLTQGLANWLVVKSSDHSTMAKIQYHMGGRVSLLGVALLSLAEAVARVVIGCFAFVLYVATLGTLQQAKNFSIEQIKKGLHSESISFVCLHSILSPKELFNHLLSTKPKASYLVEPKGPLTAEMRAIRIRKGMALIASKLRTQFKRAQKQAAKELDKNFKYLVAPAHFQGSAHTERVSDYEVGVCHFIGRRPTMEDEHLATSFNLNVGNKVYPIQLFGIFDGHAGGQASRYVKENLELKLHETLHEFCSTGLTDEAIWNALKMTFVKLEEEFTERQPGTTATVAMILDQKIWTANVGDSRTILDNGIQLTEDAKPTDPYYLKGIENRGGTVFYNRVNGILAVARAIGDQNVGAVSPRPKIYDYPIANIPKGSHLILTCDGIYDVSSTRQIARAVRSHKDLSAEELAKNIVYSAYEANSGDNLSALVIKL